MNREKVAANVWAHPRHVQSARSAPRSDSDPPPASVSRHATHGPLRWMESDEVTLYAGISELCSPIFQSSLVEGCHALKF